MLPESWLTSDERLRKRQEFGWYREELRLRPMGMKAFFVWWKQMVNG